MQITVVMSGRNVRMHTLLPTDSLMVHHIWGAYTLRPRKKGMEGDFERPWIERLNRMINRLALFAASEPRAEGENTLPVWTHKSLTYLDTEMVVLDSSRKKRQRQGNVTPNWYRNSYLIVWYVKKMIYQSFVNTHLLYIISKATSFISSIWENCARQVDSVTFGKEILTMNRSTFVYIVFKW